MFCLELVPVGFLVDIIGFRMPAPLMFSNLLQWSDQSVNAVADYLSKTFDNVVTSVGLGKYKQDTCTSKYTLFSANEAKCFRLRKIGLRMKYSIP